MKSHTVMEKARTKNHAVIGWEKHSGIFLKSGWTKFILASHKQNDEKGLLYENTQRNWCGTELLSLILQDTYQT